MHGEERQKAPDGQPLTACLNGGIAVLQCFFTLPACSNCVTTLSAMWISQQKNRVVCIHQPAFWMALWLSEFCVGPVSLKLHQCITRDGQDAGGEKRGTLKLKGHGMTDVAWDILGTHWDMGWIEVGTC